MTRGMGFRTFPNLASNTYNGVQNWSTTKFLSLSPPSTFNQKFTISAWVKLSSTGAVTGPVFEQDNLGSGVLCYANFTAARNFQILVDGSGVTYTTTNTFTSTTNWYHLVVAVDTTQATAANRQILYVNGSSQAASGTTYSLNDLVLSTTMRIGRFIGDVIPGLMAYFTYVDGQQLTPSSFSQTGIGGTVPKAYTGTFGTNGFLLNFSNTSSLGTDSSGNANNFSVNSLTSGDASSQAVFY